MPFKIKRLRFVGRNNSEIITLCSQWGIRHGIPPIIYFKKKRGQSKLSTSNTSTESTGITVFITLNCKYIPRVNTNSWFTICNSPNNFFELYNQTKVVPTLVLHNKNTQQILKSWHIQILLLFFRTIFQSNLNLHKLK